MEHRFAPTMYYRSLGPHPAALRIAAGDTVITSTVDARGFDRDRAQVTPRGNPQTGPIYIEGAEPGDTLVVQLDQVQPNRRYGWCGSSVAPGVVERYTVHSAVCSHVSNTKRKVSASIQYWQQSGAS